MLYEQQDQRFSRLKKSAWHTFISILWLCFFLVSFFVFNRVAYGNSTRLNTSVVCEEARFCPGRGGGRILKNEGGLEDSKRRLSVHLIGADNAVSAFSGDCP